MNTLQLSYEKLDQPAVLAALFHPRPEWNPPPAGAFDQEVRVADGVELPVRYHLGEEPAAVNILFFHGNGEVASDYDELAPQYRAVGLNLVVTEYRGYGRAGGTPTVTNMVRDAHAVLTAVRDTLREQGQTGRLAVMGRSLGSVPAIDLAAGAPAGAVDGLIIESGIGETLPLLRCLGLDPAALGLADESEGFRNLQKISFFDKPTYILHAQHDELIPIMSAEALQAHCAAQRKEFQIVPGAGRNTIIDQVGVLYFQAIKQFTRKLGQPERRARPGVRG